MNNTVLAGRICALVLLSRNVVLRRATQWRASTIKFVNAPLLDELEMPNASLPDGHTAGIVGTRAEYEIGVRNDFAKFYDFV